MADPVVEGRSLVVEAIRALAIACRAWAAYPSDHPNVTQAVGAAQTRVGEMLAAHGSVAVGVARNHLRVGVWTVDSAQARALAHALYQRQAAVLRMERGIQPDELRALVQWLAGPATPLEPGSPPAGPPGLPGARHLRLQPLDYSAIRLTDRAEPAPAGPPGVSITDRLLNVVLEWGVPGDADWSGDESTTQESAVPAELAMVAWLRNFLQTHAAREHGEAAPDGSAEGTGSGEPGAGPGAGNGRAGGTGAGAGSAEGGDGEAHGSGGPATGGAGTLATEDSGGAALEGGTGGTGAGRASGEGAGSGGPGASGHPQAAGETRGPDRAPGLPAWATAGSAASGVEGVAVGVGGLPGDAGLDEGEMAPGVTPRQLLVRLTDATTAHFEGMSGAGRVLAARQTAQLIMRLPEPLRDSLMRAALRVVATDAAGDDALEAFTSSMSAHPVLRVMRQLGAEGVPLSRHAQRLVELLASTRAESAEEDAPTGRDLESLRAELLTLFREEDIDRYNPEDHLALLARAMLAWPTRTPVVLGTLETLGERVASLTEDAVGRQLTETLLDLLGRHGDDKTGPVLARLEQLVQGALARGSLDEATFAIEGMARLAADETVPEPTRTAVRGQLDHLAGGETLSALAASLGAAPGPAAIRLVRFLGPGAIRSLLQVLVEEKVRVRRRRVFDLLSALGPDVVPEATRWLMDPAWYVVRNIIALLRAVGDRSSLPTVRRLTGHADLRVRLEALRSLLELDPDVGHGYLLSAIADPDPRAATAAVELAGQRGGSTMVEPLLGVLASWDIRGRRRAVRLAALQALSRMGRPEALPRLAHFFRERWVPYPSTVERRAAYESLQGYPSDARAWLVMRGLRSRDPEIRAVCERLRSAG
ncbi:MAG TPA: HEAT repeat domain-containing protein [Methylomirabilota bacterium]